MTTPPPPFTHLHYLANVRLPTEKAHGLQIVQNCEALAAFVPLTLHPARRVQPPALQNAPDPWTFYGAARTFDIRYTPCVDLLPLLGRQENRLSALAFYLQTATYIAALAWRLRRASADTVYYSRDPLVLSAFRRIKPPRRLFWEAHSLSAAPRKRQMQAELARSLGGVIAVTRKLADDLVALGLPADRVLVAPDGIRTARFAEMPSRKAARAALGLPTDAFIVGYVGRLHTMNMSKGVDDLIRAMAGQPERPLHLLLVGGPEDMAAALRQQWIAAGLPAERFHSLGHVPATEVPRALAAFDAAALPLPWTEHFAYYASPIKLFEYMAAGLPIVATDLPSTAEIVQDGDTALLVPPSDPGALAATLVRLHDDPALCARLGENGRRLAFERYTWDARARSILDFIARCLETR